MYFGEIPLIPVFNIPDNLLNRKEVFTGNDCFMVIFLPVLVTVVTIYFRLVIKVIRCKCLSGKDIPAIPFI